MVAEAQVGAALCCCPTRHKIHAEESQLLMGVGAQSFGGRVFWMAGQAVPGLVSPLSGTRVPALKTLPPGVSLVQSVPDPGLITFLV